MTTRCVLPGTGKALHGSCLHSFALAKFKSWLLFSQILIKVSQLMPLLQPPVPPFPPLPSARAAFLNAHLILGIPGLKNPSVPGMTLKNDCELCSDAIMEMPLCVCFLKSL